MDLYKGGKALQGPKKSLLDVSIGTLSGDIFLEEHQTILKIVPRCRVCYLGIYFYKKIEF